MSNLARLEQAAGIDSNPDRLEFLPIDPFAAKRDAASRVAGLGGEHASDDPGYVFQSLDIYPALGPVRFTLQFHQLAATTGTLIVRIFAISAHPGTVPMLVKSVAVDLSGVADNDGVFSVEMICRRNMVYTIGGTIDDDTDASALALSLSLDPRERDVPLPSDGPTKMSATVPGVARIENLLQRPELATMRPAVLARPVSQAMTAAQCRDPLISAWNGVIRQSGGAEFERWENAFILQVLHYYGIATDSGSGLRISSKRHPLPSYLAERGCTVLAAAMRRDDLPQGDPGLALEQLCYADLCTPRRFFEAVNLTLFEDLAIPPGLTGFDFLWSKDASVGPGARPRFPQMVRDSISCLRPGGLAIHMLRYSGEVGTPSHAASTSYGRAEIERMALSLIADGQEVAQLKFDVDTPAMPGDRGIPFALVARRMR